MNNTILIAAGGTGGHIYPGLALARVIRERGSKVLFVIKENDPSKEILNNEKFGFIEIPAFGLPRKFSLNIFKFLLFLFLGFFRAWRIIKTIKPKAVYGMGGYVSFPVVLAAKLKGFKVIVHEQNVLPGLTNRILSKFVDKVAISFNESIKYFNSKKVVLTGNPFRPEIFKVSYEDSIKKLGLIPNKFSVLVFGGSQGAAFINRCVLEAWNTLNSFKDRMQFIHIAGKKEYDRLNTEYNKAGIPGKVFPYINDIGNAYEAADLIICRSGAMTISELKILNKPAILIPFPYATANHQEYNARMLEKEGKAKVIIEKDLNPEKLAKEITDYLKSFSGHKKELKIPKVLPQDILADLIF
ncbi:MAG: undecaprenyldiphospho-muramoylpentapeptide beta-N-acetylglucosaminyltransferase [Elusimicrobia bacterium]|nr:undecaprenyldiphospho-muramoylpentapeptide beta-N-acetylglucosaminyltransferase [Elusimicrobiota bacterium]